MTFTNLLAAATVVIAGAGGSLILAQQRMVLGWICVGIAGAFLRAMALAIAAAKPTTWEFVGNTPAQWLADVESEVRSNSPSPSSARTMQA
jgi:hypothetical protein